jgi:hypothetical protein
MSLPFHGFFPQPVEGNTVTEIFDPNMNEESGSFTGNLLFGDLLALADDRRRDWAEIQKLPSIEIGLRCEIPLFSAKRRGTDFETGSCCRLRFFLGCQRLL